MKIKEIVMPFFSLFTSLSTILCCAAPIILVSLGMGAAFASLSSNFPFIIWLAERAGSLFIFSALMLSISGYFIFIKAQICPTNKDLAEICSKTKKFNKIIWVASSLILATSFFFKYVLILLVQ